MILVLLGTQDKQFVRLLQAIDKEIEKGSIKEKVLVQAGYTYGKYKSNNMEIFDLVDKDNFSKLIEECNLIITHGGVGSIIEGIKNNKIVIACPRLSKYKEHINDHQIQIVNNFSQAGYIIPYYDGDNLGKILKKTKNFKTKKFISNTDNIISIIDEFIQNN